MSRAGFAKVNGVQQEDSKAEVLRKSVSHACNENGIDAYFPILRQVVTLDEAMDPATARKNMVETTEQVMRLVAAVK